MNRFQMENIYEVNGLDDYRLNTSEDLLKCHGISIPCVSGYSDLTEENKVIFNKFIISYLNGLGLEKRMGIVPRSINFVEDINYTAPDPDEPEEKYVVTVLRKITVLKADSNKELLHEHKYKEYKGIKPTKGTKTTYLRFEYKEGKSLEWLHVTHGGSQWY